MKLSVFLLLMLSSIYLLGQESNTIAHDVLGHGFDVRYLDVLDWGKSSKGKKLFLQKSNATSITGESNVDYHFITSPYLFEKEILNANKGDRPFLSLNSEAYYKNLEKEENKVLVVYTEKRKPVQKRSLSRPALQLLDSAMVADFSRLGRDITPYGFISRYGTHFASQVVYGGLFLKRNLISNDDFIYSPYPKEKFKKQVIIDITASHTRAQDPDPYISSGTSNSFTVGGDTKARWFTDWEPTVAQNLYPIDVTLQTYSQLFKKLHIPDIDEKELKIKMLDSIIEIATQKVQESVQKSTKDQFYKKYSLRFKQTLHSFVKKSMGTPSESKTTYTGDLFFGGFSKDEAILKSSPLIDIGGLRLETLITDEKVVLDKSIEITVKPEDLDIGYVSVWDDTKKLVKSNERKRLRVSGPEEAKTTYKEALVRNLTKEVEITTIDGDVYEVDYTLQLVKEKKILENFSQSYNNALQTELIAAATVGDIDLLEKLFQTNKNRRLPGLIQTVITTKQSPELLNLILDKGVKPTIEDLDLLFEKDYFDEQKILILLERGAPFKNNMIYKSVAYKSSNIIYALLREGAQPRNNDLAFALEKHYYPTIKALMSVDFEAFETNKNDLLLAVENNDPDLAKKFIDLGATSDYLILEKALEKNNELLKNVVVPVTEAENKTLLSVAKANNTALFSYFVNKKARLEDNTAAEIAIDNENNEILDLALKNGAVPTQALTYAIEKENDTAILIALKNKAVPDSVFSYAAKKEEATLFNDALNIYGGTPSIALLAAVRENRVAFAESVIKTKKEDLNVSDALSKAVGNENLDMIKLLVRNNANPSEGIREAIRVESTPITEYLIAQGAQTVNPELIEEAVKKGNLNLSKILVEKGNSKVDDGIINSAMTGNTQITSYFLEQGANTVEALKAAIETKNEEVILLLLEKSKAPLEPSFLYSSTRKGNLKVLTRLIDWGLDPSLPLEDAIRYKKEEALKLLLDKGGIPTQEHLRIALEYHFIAGTKLLIAHPSIKVDTPFKDGQFPLHIISSTPNEEDLKIARLLIDNGANVNAQNNNGATAIHLLSLKNDASIPMVDFLLDKGALPNIKDNYGRTAIDITESRSIRTRLKKAARKN